MDQSAQGVAQRNNSSSALPDELSFGDAVRRQVAQPGKHAAQLLMLNFIAHRIENHRYGLRVNGQFFVVILNVKTLFIQRQPDVASDQLGSVLIAQNGQQQLILQLSFQRVPVNVKKLGKF